jgi:hypothetical protein
MLEDAVHHRGRNAGLFKQVAQRLPGLHPQNLPAVPGRFSLPRQRQRRQGQCESGIGQRHGGIDGVGEARHDRRGQRADGHEQAGVDPVTAGPALVESGRQMPLELSMQGGVVEDVEAFLEALLARLAMIGIRHQCGSLVDPNRGPKRG